MNNEFLCFTGSHRPLLSIVIRSGWNRGSTPLTRQTRAYLAIDLMQFIGLLGVDPSSPIRPMCSRITVFLMRVLDYGNKLSAFLVSFLPVRIFKTRLEQAWLYLNNQANSYPLHVTTQSVDYNCCSFTISCLCFFIRARYEQLFAVINNSRFFLFFLYRTKFCVNSVEQC